MIPQADAERCLRACRREGDTARGEVCFPAELPIFAGHFPGEPVVPGVYVVAAVLAVLRRALEEPDLAIHRLDRVKWTSLALPDDVLEVALEWRQAGKRGLRVDGTVSKGGEVNCKCRLRVKSNS